MWYVVQRFKDAMMIQTRLVDPTGLVTQDRSFIYFEPETSVVIISYPSQEMAEWAFSQLITNTPDHLEGSTRGMYDQTILRQVITSEIIGSENPE